MKYNLICILNGFQGKMNRLYGCLNISDVILFMKYSFFAESDIRQGVDAKNELFGELVIELFFFKILINNYTTNTLQLIEF